MKTAGLYAGIGGLERGFEIAGFETALVAEVEPNCREVLRAKFPTATVWDDVANINKLPSVDVLLAGFPCQPYSPAGQTHGLARGRWHIDQIFRLLDSRTRGSPKHVVLENVPFLVHLDDGMALDYVLRELEKRGYLWAYRVVDTSAFGLPQRRRRWILIASRTADPAAMLLEEDSIPYKPTDIRANGFYWTEGNKGIGWADDSVPPLKGGSKVGISSPPAIWAHEERAIWVPQIEGAERLQGFDEGWTEVATTKVGRGARERWRMVGNAVSVPTAQWVAERILVEPNVIVEGERLLRYEPFPRAAFYDGLRRYKSPAGLSPRGLPFEPILDFLQDDLRPLSFRATHGFRVRYEASTLRKNASFIADLKYHERHFSA